MADDIGFDPVALSIDGGRHAADLFRLGLYAATSGAEGIVTPGDCKVRALSTPGPQFTIDPGALLIRNRSADVYNQTYAANGRRLSTMDAPPMSSSDLSHLVIVRLEDPQFSPWPKPADADAPTYQYTKPFVLQNVPPGTKSAKELSLGYSAYALARLDIPANRANVDPSYIVDLRKLALPQEHIERAEYMPAAGSNLTSTTAVVWPPDSKLDIEVPPWATYFYMKATISGFEISNIVADATGGALGQLRGVLGTKPGAWQNFDYNGATNMDGARSTIVLGVNDYCSDMAGTTVQAWIEGLHDASESGYLRTVNGIHVDYDIVFQQRAV